MENKKKVELDQILALIKSGKSPAQISKEFKIPKGTLAYSLDKLKKMGCIEKVGYGTWNYLKEVRTRPKGTQAGDSNLSKKRGEKEIRGHAFIWRIEFEKSYNWDSLVASYKKKTLTFQPICRGKVHRLIFKNRKIWLTNKGMVIYEPLDFFGTSSFEVKGTAVFQMDMLVKDLIAELGSKFYRYRFTTSREHYGIVKNELARQYNDKKEKLHVKAEDGSIWLWIDDSKGLGELETADPTLNREVQNFWNDNIKKHHGKVDASFTLKAIDGLTAAQVETNRQLLKYEEQNREHLKVIQMYQEESKLRQQESKLRQEEAQFNKKVMMKLLKKLG